MTASKISLVCLLLFSAVYTVVSQLENCRSKYSYFTILSKLRLLSYIWESVVSGNNLKVYVAIQDFIALIFVSTNTC